MMRKLVRNYLKFARGEKRCSVWGVIAPLGLLTRMIVGIRTFCYDHGIMVSCDPPIPVISVGNITFGGTNKTPFVEMLARGLKGAGIKVGIVSRGYGGSASEPVLLKNGNVSRKIVGDEPLLLSSRLRDVPIAVSKDRLKDVDILREEGVEVVLADDAFQHRRLARDVDIVLVDASCPFGNGLFVPSGILREAPESLVRADIVVITKSDLVERKTLENLIRHLGRWVPEERLFCSKLEVTSWSVWSSGRWVGYDERKLPGTRVVAFSAIGSPGSFFCSLASNGLVVLKKNLFKDHHRFSMHEIERMHSYLLDQGGDMLVCTEKDIFNLPEEVRGRYKFLVPRISTVIDDEHRFYSLITECLKPRIIVTSNGFGEDSIGALLASEVQETFPGAEVFGFPIVGLGENYARKNVEVISCPHISPTGGVIKYSIKAFLKDLRAGLLRNIVRQIVMWGTLKRNVRTVICVGDVYLLIQTLLGQGKVPVLVATAKTVYLTGHWKLEVFLLKHRCRRVWTRDEDTAKELRRSGADAIFAGNPIMDLIGESDGKQDDPWGFGRGRKILLLPGSRLRAYRDMAMLLEAATLISSRIPATFICVVAATLEVEEILQSNTEWERIEEGELCIIERKGVRILLYDGPLVNAARNAELLIGLGGTANQVCAGLGVPVVSILEKGKLVQKKLLGESELLVEAEPRKLAAAAMSILDNPELSSSMSAAGMKRLGGPGSMKNIIQYLEEDLGTNLRCSVYSKLSGISSEDCSGQVELC